MNRLPTEILREYNKYPLAHRLRFTHVLQEKDLDIACVTITDVGFLSLFLKHILQTLYHYTRCLRNSNFDKEKYLSLVDNLIMVFVYRPIVIQKSYSYIVR
jgi:hypothetical protein